VEAPNPTPGLVHVLYVQDGKPGKRPGQGRKPKEKE
jgi:hypothetical protein